MSLMCSIISLMRLYINRQIKMVMTAGVMTIQNSISQSYIRHNAADEAGTL